MASHQPHYTDEVAQIHEVPDEWHAHTPEEGRPQHEHGAYANPVILGIVFVAMFGSLLITCIALFIYFDSYVAQRRAERQESTVMNAQARLYRETSMTGLEQYDWVDRGAGTIRIPIDRAKRLVLDDYRRAATGAP